ncbi:PEP-CTERM sorting domain-containing protein [Sideroxydans sp. CL21]|uniref:PEP-CTERM sorting domain-containing protein n=1 Tax=Sideroxydans sp. CL21 TaxID=2600596 RepID=UPI0024BC487B|nr:PEP-CTERM sorting domain-containing protein [Sideroxydans sp. CL21]
MKQHAKFQIALVMFACLGLFSINATATALDRQSSSIFNTQDSTTFSHNTAGDFTNSNVRFIFSASGKDGNFTFAADPNGPSFESFLNSSRQHPEQDGSEPHIPNIGDRDINQHEWNRDDGFPVSPIPEPAEYILMACGLALLGFAANRRRNRQGLATD